MEPHGTNDTELASGFSVADCNRAIAEKDREAIAKAIHLRFTERYISPISDDPKERHGFSIMAICCLMIEALESFHQGWTSTNDKPKEAFEEFFKREPAFMELRGFERYFYKNVRCGILHQGETYNGWKIIRKGPLFNQSTRTLNAVKFLSAMKKILDDFCDELEKAEWGSTEWRNVIKKMEALCRNCEIQNPKNCRSARP